MIGRDDRQQSNNQQPSADKVAYESFRGISRPMTPEALEASEEFYKRYSGTNCSVLGELSTPKPSGEKPSTYPTIEGFYNSSSTH
jgi:hypothetical protein